MDGTYGINPAALEFPEVDLYSDHFYPMNSKRMIAGAQAVANAKKVYIAGEYSWKNPELTMGFLTAAQENKAVSGTQYWSLFPHADGHGFVQHGDGFTVHYPGDNTVRLYHQAHAATYPPHALHATLTPYRIHTVRPHLLEYCSILLLCDAARARRGALTWCQADPPLSSPAHFKKKTASAMGGLFPATKLPRCQTHGWLGCAAIHATQTMQLHATTAPVPTLWRSLCSSLAPMLPPCPVSARD